MTVSSFLSPAGSINEVPGAAEFVTAELGMLRRSRLLNASDTNTLEIGDRGKKVVISRTTANTFYLPRGSDIPDEAFGVIYIESTGLTTIMGSGGNVFLKTKRDLYIVANGTGGYARSDGIQSMIFWHKTNLENYYLSGDLLPVT